MNIKSYCNTDYLVLNFFKVIILWNFIVNETYFCQSIFSAEFSNTFFSMNQLKPIFYILYTFCNIQQHILLFFWLTRFLTFSIFSAILCILVGVNYTILSFMFNCTYWLCSRFFFLKILNINHKYKSHQFITK